MTDLERQLTAALEKLSGQYEREQRRHAEHVEALRRQVEALQRQVEALQRQVERLSAQVTDLAGSSGTYGAGRGGRWR